jgi:hypothetical protein
VALERFEAGGFSIENYLAHWAVIILVVLLVSPAAVIPAKAGIQALIGIARLARDLKSYVRVAPPLHPGFLSLFVKEKNQLVECALLFHHMRACQNSP